uniref:Ion transport domain-containing protein n=1 Tax=Oxyrrhis marina TaxID=2969 RepID=A0A7S3UIV8_OXYMA
MRRTIKGNGFQLAIGAVIVLNAVLIGVETEVVGADDTNASPLWFVIEVVFALVFSIELGLKVWAYHVRPFFSDVANVLDTFLVVMAVVDVCILSHLGEFDSGVLTVLRIVRLCRLCRLLRLLRIFRELWLMIAGLASSTRTLFWGSSLMFIIFKTQCPSSFVVECHQFSSKVLQRITPLLLG